MRPGLYAVSFIEVNSSAYTLFDHVANLIAQHLADESADPAKAARFDELAKTDHPDLTGGVKFVASDRHANYVEVRAYRKALARVRRLLGWQTLTSGMYDGVKAGVPA